MQFPLEEKETSVRSCAVSAKSSAAQTYAYINELRDDYDQDADTNATINFLLPTREKKEQKALKEETPAILSIFADSKPTYKGPKEPPLASAETLPLVLQEVIRLLPSIDNATDRASVLNHLIDYEINLSNRGKAVARRVVKLQ